MGKTFDKYCYITTNKIGRISYRGKKLYFINDNDKYFFFYDLERLGFASKQSILKHFERIKDTDLKDNLEVSVVRFRLEIDDCNAPKKLTPIETFILKRV